MPHCTCEFPRSDPYCERHGRPFARFDAFIPRSDVRAAIESFIALWSQAAKEFKTTKRAAAAITKAHAPLFALLARAQAHDGKESEMNSGDLIAAMMRDGTGA